MKEDKKNIVRKIDEAEAEEKKITPEEARQKRSRMVARNKRKLADTQYIMLSDEETASEGEDEFFKADASDDEEEKSQVKDNKTAGSAAA